MPSQKSKEFSRIIIKGIFWAGVIALASTSPYFVPLVMPKIFRYAKYKWSQKKKKQKFYDAFYYLKRKGFINIENKSGQIYISLTKEGKKLAGKYQIDDLMIKKPKKWDGKWRILIFDIENKKRIKREALRGKLKELGLFQLQKSVWIHPFDFKKEIILLRSFFALSKNEMQIITASQIENDQSAKTFFKLTS